MLMNVRKAPRGARLTVVWLGTWQSDLPIYTHVRSIAFEQQTPIDLVYHAFRLALDGLEAESIEVRQLFLQGLTPWLYTWSNGTVSEVRTLEDRVVLLHWYFCPEYLDLKLPLVYCNLGMLPSLGIKCLVGRRVRVLEIVSKRSARRLVLCPTFSMIGHQRS